MPSRTQTGLDRASEVVARQKDDGLRKSRIGEIQRVLHYAPDFAWFTQTARSGVLSQAEVRFRARVASGERESGESDVIYRRLSVWGRVGLAILAVHTVLLFLPPIPPDIKGPLVNWVAGYTVVFLFLVEFTRQRSLVVAYWAAATARRRRAITLGLAIGVLAVGLPVRAIVPKIYLSLSAEYGLVEPATLFIYLATAITLFAASLEMEQREKKHWRFLAGLYFLMGLEEIDYFGIFGSMFGRIEGVYAGSLHDLIRLIGNGVLAPGVIMTIAAIFLVVAAWLWRAGYLQPRELFSLMRSRDFLWVVLAFAFLVIAAADDAHIFGWQASPAYEEVFELSATIFLAVFALQLTTRR